MACEMRGSAQLFSSTAPLAAATDTFHIPPDTAPSYEVLSRRHDVDFHREGSTHSFLKFLVAAAVVAMVLAAVWCFNALQSDGFSSSSAANKRRIAERGSYPCTVGLGKRSRVPMPC